ncbi:GTP cyclohydrolase II [Extremus antarcticus]|uniref:GTP cyclohydrolase II n=1 Tax=Extremus antarcticus TaxID=702011 RepID=A0AAJ0DE77_9PEZI|nr:GTP cyclohydrolase II [Extremus antarcticus]
MPDFPAHASPAFTPAASPRARPKGHDRTVSDLRLTREGEKGVVGVPAPPLVSPAYTPPRTPDVGVGHDGEPAVDDRAELGPKTKAQFLDELPEVTCEVRARIPTTTGTEMWLHLYHNNADEKEHLAIVFGPNIRSKSLDRQRPGESERERMIRGAYVGTLYPGRTSSRRVEEIKKEAGFGGTLPASSPASSEELSMQASEGSETTYPPSLGPPLVRIHSECYTGETVWSARCDCGEQLDEAARLMSLPWPTPSTTPGSDTPNSHSHSLPFDPTPVPSCGGVIIYLRQEGRGIGLLSKLKAYNLQDLGHDTMEANLLLRHPGDARSYGLATSMLLDLGLGGENGIKLLTNNPEKVRAVEGPNQEIRVVERVPMIPLAWKTGGLEGVRGPEVERYLATKIEKFKHMFSG